jgi:hypothetical protein
MKYVKLIAKPDTWFKAGTEVFSYDEFGVRITLESYNKWLKSGSILARGIHMYEDGVEAEDGELCGIDEFDMIIVDDEKDIPWPKILGEILKEAGIGITIDEETRKRNFEDGIRHIQG